MIVALVLGVPLVVLGGLAYLLYSRTGDGETSRRVETLEDEVSALRETVADLESDGGDDSEAED